MCGIVKQTEVFLIAMSYHSKAAAGRLVLVPKAPDPFGLR
jgi:hypothetical protein